MESLCYIIDARLSFLEQFVENCQKSLRHAPGGHLRVCQEKNRCQYYHVTEDGTKNGKYLKKKDVKLRSTLAMKDYAEQALPIAQKELAVLRKCRSALPTPAAEEVYDTLHPLRKNCFVPFCLPDDLYVQNWVNASFSTKGVGDDVPEFFTDNGERVRSKSEVLIADKLKKLGIPYRYECELQLKNGIIIYPDFTVLNVRKRQIYYYEHLGMMDDPLYVQSVIQRFEWYRQNGIFLGVQLFVTWETRNFPLVMRSAEQLYRSIFL